MRRISLRRVVPVGMAAAAALAVGLPSVASAKKPPPWTTDDLTHCEGASPIHGEGSTFAAPAEYLWTGFNEKTATSTGTGFNVSGNAAACSETKKPEVRYTQGKAIDEGSGSCLKTWGNGIASFHHELKTGSESDFYPRVKEFPFCGTDEAPSKAVKEEFESTKFVTDEAGFATGNGEAIESIPVAQGAVAIIVHLPEDCTAESEITTSAGKVEKPHRLALDQATVRGIYEGAIRTWAAAVTAQGGPTGDGKNKLTCTGGGENDKIGVVVRRDKSGTTHIFKSFLAQVEPITEPTFEAFETINGTEHPCEKSGSTEEKYAKPFKESWKEVQEGCQNQRWPAIEPTEEEPEGFKVIRPAKTGNGAVIQEVNTTASSIGYADLAFAQEEKFFTKKETVEGSGKTEVHTHNGGGENSTKEFEHRFWAVIQDSTPGLTPVTFEDPSTKDDREKEGNSNCKESKYVAAKGEPFPPESTRLDWSKVKAENASATYPICGLTYVIAARQYYFFLKPYLEEALLTPEQVEAESKKIATAVHDYLLWVVNTKGEGGGKTLKNHDYEGLTKEVAEKATKGAEEIGSKVSEEG